MIKKTKRNQDLSYASQRQLMWRKFKRHKVALAGLFVLSLFYLCALFCEFVSPYSPTTRNQDYKSLAPQLIRVYDAKTGFHFPFVYGVSNQLDLTTFQRTGVLDTDAMYPVRLFTRGETYKLWGLFETDIHLFTSDGPMYLLGTDATGRDLFSRIVYGARTSLSVGLVGLFITFVLGLALGGVSGFFGGAVDEAVQRAIDFIICIPGIPLWMTLAAALPADWPPIKTYLCIVVITSVIGWTNLARVVRGRMLSVRKEAYISAAKVAGAGSVYLIRRHMLPSFGSYIIVALTMSIPGTILGETSLSFLGLGLNPPAISWGVLLQDAQNLESIAHSPWLLSPAIFIIIVVVMFNFLGDGLRDAADPYKMEGLL